MRQLIAFTKKEFMEVIRSGKIYILLVIFFIFGIMNPGIAKLTPFLFKMLSESLKDKGLTVMEITVNAMTSWEQYYKNMSMEFIIFVVMFCGIVTSEYEKGTLINIVTKGLPRWKILISKSIAMIIIWTLCYWLSFGVTFSYNAYFWDNSIVDNIMFAAMSSYLLGIWLISLIILSSTFVKSSSSVLLTSGGVYVVIYLLNIIPKIKNYLPIRLSLGMDILKSATTSNYTISILVTIILIILGYSISIIGFNKRKI